MEFNELKAGTKRHVKLLSRYYLSGKSTEYNDSRKIDCNINNWCERNDGNCIRNEQIRGKLNAYPI